MIFESKCFGIWQTFEKTFLNQAQQKEKLDASKSQRQRKILEKLICQSCNNIHQLHVSQKRILTALIYYSLRPILLIQIIKNICSKLLVNLQDQDRFNLKNSIYP